MSEKTIDKFCDDILKKLATKFNVPVELITTRLLDDNDKQDMRDGLLLIASLEAHIELWKANGMPDVAHGKTEPDDPEERLVTCNNCEHFTHDSIGDGAGIGGCGLGIKWTQELHGRMPLYRYAKRHCKDFSKLMS